MSVDKLPTSARNAAKSSSWGAQAVQLVAIVLIVFLAKGAIAEPFYVPSGSMEPTLMIGDALLASKYPYGYGTEASKIYLDAIERRFGAPEPGAVEARPSGAPAGD